MSRGRGPEVQGRWLDYRGQSQAVAAFLREMAPRPGLHGQQGYRAEQGRGWDTC